mmetsp:Transcript_63345/g.178817  ORF Transcript_63345/g.178817 Transcript_63345/m.178817 type:complete len:244 (-) Transcript_63345:615-1346(-)
MPCRLHRPAELVLRNLGGPLQVMLTPCRLVHRRCCCPDSRACCTRTTAVATGDGAQHGGYRTSFAGGEPDDLKRVDPRDVDNWVLGLLQAELLLGRQRACQQACALVRHPHRREVVRPQCEVRVRWRKLRELRRQQAVHSQAAAEHGFCCRCRERQQRLDRRRELRPVLRAEIHGRDPPERELGGLAPGLGRQVHGRAGHEHWPGRYRRAQLRPPDPGCRPGNLRLGMRSTVRRLQQAGLRLR